MFPPLNLLAGALCLALAFCSLSLAVYYIAPPAGPNLSHYIDPATGEWKRKTWAKAVGPLYEVGQRLRYDFHLPMKRLPPLSLYE